jgi:hypothetical protein
VDWDGKEVDLYRDNAGAACEVVNSDQLSKAQYDWLRDRIWHAPLDETIDPEA